MNDSERLIKDIERADMHQRAWDNTVQPFYEAKMLELFDAFTDSQTTDERGLLILKLQANALSSLKDNFLSYINSGKMARQELNRKEQENNDG